PSPALDILRQFSQLHFTVLIRSADAGIDGRFHSAPLSTTSAAPSITTITTITWMGGRSANSVSDAAKPKRRPSQKPLSFTATSESGGRPAHARTTAVLSSEF